MAEDQNIEYKKSWRDEYLKWICGFANAQGGKLYIGIDDDKRIVGVENSHRLLEDIPNKIATTMGIVCDVNLRKKTGKSILKSLSNQAMCLLLTKANTTLEVVPPNNS